MSNAVLSFAGRLRLLKQIEELNFTRFVVSGLVCHTGCLKVCHIYFYGIPILSAERFRLNGNCRSRGWDPGLHVWVCVSPGSHQCKMFISPVFLRIQLRGRGGGEGKEEQKGTE